ncbi:hypothetical protein DM558_06080 [Entomomonas moraniae]|uniref:PIN like domain-containing protein n=1 Tax=Entomomonas moraniae TaxID=2213226 RepID=A0A3Q9JIP3_9GAMM|nr:PIN-like domain-containing protein [Entomomonas moraniae]AZS50369.1 hypothetical protein DM558_06080 [Entomomonas moraniae]
MKNKFKGYYQLSPSDFDKLWENAIFIFDTNVLLNLYRYKESTRKELLSVIKELNNRVWIPYHVGLEFQRNRLKVIAEQHKKYNEVNDSISKNISKIEADLAALKLKNRHSHINPDQLLKNIDSAKNAFIKELDNLKQQSINVSSEDEIRNRIDKLFDNRVGNPPADQKGIDDLFKEAENRYKNSIPPGFMDAEKDKEKPDGFIYGGITYKRKYGDFLIWKQIIEYAKDESLTDIIFITDDNKSDWWLQVESDGTKTLGVRPELVDEITREAKIERFYMYSTESFLSYAKPKLKTKVTNDAIEEIRDINHKSHGLGELPPNTDASKIVLDWLYGKFLYLQYINEVMPFYVTRHDNELLGFNIIVEFDRNVFKLGLSLAKRVIAMELCSRVITICIIPIWDVRDRQIAEEIFNLEQNEKLGFLIGYPRQVFKPSSSLDYRKMLHLEFAPYFSSKNARFLI